VLLHQPAHDGLQRIVAQHLQVFGEQRPDALHDEARQHLGRYSVTVLERLVQGRHLSAGIEGELAMVLDERRFLASAEEEAERLVVLRQLGQGQVGGRAGRVLMHVPDQEPVERAEHDVAHRPVGPVRRGRAAPVALGLWLRVLERRGEARLLHLDQRLARPEHVHEAGTGNEVLEEHPGALPVQPVAVDELVEEGLCLGLLAAGEVLPPADERAQSGLDLLPTAHAQSRRVVSAGK